MNELSPSLAFPPPNSTNPYGDASFSINPTGTQTYPSLLDLPPAPSSFYTPRDSPSFPSRRHMTATGTSPSPHQPILRILLYPLK